MNQEEIAEKYKNQFVPEDYPEAMQTDIPSVYAFYQRELHTIFSSPSFYGRKLLDVGCGPTVHTVFPATKTMDDIVLSDFLPQNRLAVEKRLQKAPALDWSFQSESLAALEGFTDVKSGAREIEERTRRAIRKVIFCNVLDPQVLPEEHKESFDVVLTSLCLETASSNEETYQKAIQNLSSLVIDGGHLIVCGICGANKYSVKEASFPVISVTVYLAKESIARSGFKIERCSLLQRDASHAKDTYYWKHAFVILARKP
ncbi:indolethylamine N-methyltransferase [Ixodes scapularis]|uniref:indolethylamine N-methyltransferase n=1 Tax=Ixodes scapularis TaxID=6945 RepID=UPI001A9DF0E0|nr:indolethylamine N-methyltransferase [Ixodes scapularis]